jgi:hypothetical protein
MKKLMIIIALIVSINAQAQIATLKNLTVVKIGEINIMTHLMAYLNYGFTDTDTTFSLHYYNAKYPALQQFESITFTGGMQTVNQLYDVFITFFTEENKGKKTGEVKKTIMLGDKTLVITNMLYSGNQYVNFTTDNGYSTDFNKKQIDKLFGRYVPQQ